MPRIFLGLFISLFCLGVVYANSKFIDQPAPDFALKNTDGKNLRLSEYVGEVVLLNFGADWCGQCAQDRRVLEDLHTKFAGLGFVVLGVNMDKDANRASHMAKELNLTYPVLFDGGKRVSKTYKIDAIPTTVLVDRDGNVRHVFSGYKANAEVYQSELRELLKE